MTGGERGALPGERRACGRPAVVALASARWGEVGWCGLNDGGRRGPCAFCDTDARHDGLRCSSYTLRPTHIADNSDPA